MKMSNAVMKFTTGAALLGTMFANTSCDKGGVEPKPPTTPEVVSVYKELGIVGSTTGTQLISAVNSAAGDKFFGEGEEVIQLAVNPNSTEDVTVTFEGQVGTKIADGTSYAKYDVSNNKVVEVVKFGKARLIKVQKAGDPPGQYEEKLVKELRLNFKEMTVAKIQKGFETPLEDPAQVIGAANGKKDDVERLLKL